MNASRRQLAVVALAALAPFLTLFPAGNPTSANNTSTQPGSLTTTSSHTCAVQVGGTVKCWGGNTSGQLGPGNPFGSSVPVPVAALADPALSVSAGGPHTCAITVGTTLHCWGFNGQGALGDGTTTSSNLPVEVIGFASDTAFVTAGSSHTCAISIGTSGLECWGRNTDGQLGDGSSTPRNAPVDVVGLGSNVAAVDAGPFTTCAVPDDGSLKCWGDNSRGQVGDGTTVDRLVPTSVTGLSSSVLQVASGFEHTCALTNGGAVSCWGGNAVGQLGDGTVFDRFSPAPVQGLSSGVTDISSGGFHSCAVTAAGNVMCWGSNSRGPLGDGSVLNRPIPVMVQGIQGTVIDVEGGGDGTCALTDAGVLYCWGRNGAGQIGNGGSEQLTGAEHVATSAHASQVVLLDIPDATSASVTHSLIIEGDEVIQDVNAWVSLTHTWVGDLSIKLTHDIEGEAPTEVVLMDHPGVPPTATGCSGPDMQADFDDEASRPVNDECSLTSPAIHGSVLPEGSLSAVNGQTARGIWSLTVLDDAPGDSGVLHEWILFLSTKGGAGQPVPPPGGQAGDANCDGTVNAIDAALILQLAAEFAGLDVCLSADANASGDIDAIDAALVLQFVAGLLVGLPP